MPPPVAPRPPRRGKLWADTLDHHVEEAVMTDHTYRVTEIVGSSTESIDKAIHNGLARASSTLRNLDWFEVSDIRGHLEDGEIAHFQVAMKVGFRLDAPTD
jgi:flavin-binding protein dodecin